MNEVDDKADGAKPVDANNAAQAAKPDITQSATPAPVEAKTVSETPAPTTATEPQKTQQSGEPSEPAKPTPTPTPASAPKSETSAAAAPPVEPPKNDRPAPQPTAGVGSFLRRSAPAPVATSMTPPEKPAAPQPKKKPRRDGTLSVASGFLSFLLVVMVAGAFGWIAATHKLKEPGPLDVDKVVYIPPRSDLPEILSQLQREGVISDPNLMYFALLLEHKMGKIKQGEYEFKKNVSLHDVIDQLIEGRQLLHSVTIPEGLTSEQIVQRLKEVEFLSGDVAEIPKEGSLLPETYKFTRGFPRARLIAKMQEDQRKILQAIWNKRSPDLPLNSAYELVTLASIVEKETGKVEERPKVAAVFVNRLRKHMRLQSDPTIVYGLVGGKATLGHGILRSEIDKYTPYNTYQIDGLPPGPIANPGRAALEATAHPAKIDALYFVADGTGGHTFSGSLGDHSRAVQNWRKLEKDKKETIDRGAPDAPAPEAPPLKGDKRTEAPIGTLLNLAQRHEDYPPGRAMSPDDGPTHRLGKFSAADAAFQLGGEVDPTALNARDYAALRPARPFFTEELAQPRAGSFDEQLLAANIPAEEPQAEDAGQLNPDMVTVGVARESADGRALPEEIDGIATYPVSAARRAEQKARAAKLGLAAGSDELPKEVIGEKVAAETAQAPAASPSVDASNQALALAPAAQPRRPRAFDASEGTALDPLRDRSWDLTSAKTVPGGSTIR